MKRLYTGSMAVMLLTAFVSTVTAQDGAALIDKKSEAVKASGEVVAAMAQFKVVAQSTLDLVAKGDMAAAKTEITKLESAWDDKEKELEPKYPAEWKLIDKAIDKALATLRKPATPDADKCKATLQDVIDKIAKPVADAGSTDKKSKKE